MTVETHSKCPAAITKLTKSSKSLERHCRWEQELFTFYKLRGIIIKEMRWKLSRHVPNWKACSNYCRNYYTATMCFCAAWRHTASAADLSWRVFQSDCYMRSFPAFARILTFVILLGIPPTSPRRYLSPIRKLRYTSWALYIVQRIFTAIFSNHGIPDSFVKDLF